MSHVLKFFFLLGIVFAHPALSQASSAANTVVNLRNPHFNAGNWGEVKAYLDSRRIVASDVTRLSLIQCRLTTFPAWIIEKMPNLLYLDIQDNAITALPENIDRLTRLSNIKAQNNKLAGLPPSFGNLTNLIKANFSHNNLKNLSKDLGKLVKLIQFDLSHNQIGTLPDLSGLRNLTTLSLSHNEDIRFEPDPQPLIFLMRLNLSHCNLKTVPSFLGRFRTLHHLNLEGNPLVQQGTGDKWGKNELTQKFGHRVRF